MRVLVLSNHYPHAEAHPDNFGGVQRNAQFCAEALAAAGHQVEALVFNNAPRDRVDMVNGVRVVRASQIMKGAAQPLSLTFLAHLARARADLIHLHWPNVVAAFGLHLAHRRTPLVVTHHLDVVRQKRLKHVVNPAYRALLARAAGVISYTAAYAEASGDLRPHRGKWAIIPHAIAPAPYADPALAAPAADLRARYAGARPLVAYMGRLVEHKGPQILLRALARLPQAAGVIAGGGPLLGPLVREAMALGVADRVAFPGALDEAAKRALFAACDVFVLPALTRAEAFGQVLVEAQMAGRPVVTTDIASGMREIAGDGAFGALVPPGDVAALAAALDGLLADPARRRRQGEEGRAAAIARYGDAAVRRRVQDYFAALAPRPAPAPTAAPQSLSASSTHSP